MVEDINTLIEIPSIKKNYFYNSIINITNLLFPLITFAYIARIFGPENFGKINFCLSLSGFFCLMACFGIPSYGTTVIAKVRDNKELRSKAFSELFIFVLLSSITSFLLYFLSLMIFYNRIQHDMSLFVILGLNVLLTFTNIDWLYQGMENYGYLSIRNIICRIVSIIALFACIHKPTDYVFFAVISVAVLLVPNVHALIKARKLVNFTFKQLDCLQHVKPFLLILGTLLTVSVYTNLDNVFLGMLGGEIYVGYYSTAIKILRICVTLVTSLGTVLLPRISYYIEHNHDTELENLTKKSWEFVCFVTYPVIFGLFVFAPQIVYFLAGDKFNNSILTLRIGVIIIPFMGLSNLIGIQILIPKGKLGKLLVATFMAACVSVLFDVLLIPHFKHNGAIIATLLAEFTGVTVLLALAGKKYIPFKVFSKKTLQYFIISMFLGALCFLMQLYYPAMGSIYLVAAVVSLLLYVAILVFLKDDMAMGCIKTIQRQIPLWKIQ